MNGLKKPLGKFLSHKLKTEHQKCMMKLVHILQVPRFKMIQFFQSWTRQLKDIEPEISRNLIFQLLGEFNWRSRSTAAFLQA